MVFGVFCSGLYVLGGGASGMGMEKCDRYSYVSTLGICFMMCIFLGGGEA